MVKVRVGRTKGQSGRRWQRHHGRIEEAMQDVLHGRSFLAVSVSQNNLEHFMSSYEPVGGLGPLPKKMLSGRHLGIKPSIPFPNDQTLHHGQYPGPHVSLCGVNLPARASPGSVWVA